MEYEVEITEEGEVKINDEIINETIFNEEKVDYILRDREDMIDLLIDWIGEATTDKEIMKTDLKYLINLPDEYVFSNINTNEYIAKSDNKEEFNTICEEILKANKEVIK